MALVFLPALIAPAQSPKENQLKAVLLLNLARFVDWPESAFAAPDSPIVIGILGHDPFGRTLDEAVQGEQVNGRPIVVERYANLSAVRPCQILFICNNERGHIADVLRAVQGKPVLTVSELDGFAASLGGMVRVYTNSQNKIRLQINLEAARAEKLQLSAKLLQVAELTRRT